MSKIRRDLGRALLENEPGDGMAPEVRQYKQRDHKQRPYRHRRKQIAKKFLND